ncbi:hypothetical protein NEILACOT_05753, partial [Neisseria lactamica ATCC 23970]
MPKTTTFPAAPRPRLPLRRPPNSFRPARQGPQNLIGSQGQMIIDNRADFTVEQCCRIGMDTQISAAERAVTSST